MKRKFGIATATAIAVITFLSTKSSPSKNGLDITSLIKVNSASAECCSAPFNDGRCSVVFNVCIANPGGYVDCDTTCS